MRATDLSLRWQAASERFAKAALAYGRPRVKICGVTTVEDALLSCELGADLLGLNFYLPSPRALSVESARRIADAVRSDFPDVLLVGVFVNHPEAELNRIDRTVELDLLQFHGDESRATVAPHDARAIRALRVDRSLDAEVLRGWRSCWALLLDAAHPTLYGGSGSAWDFGSAAPLAQASRLLLAGGLSPENVVEALSAVPGAWALDLCSGVEAAPGRKDPDKLAAFFGALSARQPARAASANGSPAARRPLSCTKD
jgi:phosphoribosylanthranilate isomerase